MSGLEYGDIDPSILDKSLPVNPKYLEFDKRTGRTFVIADCQRCVWCQWTSSPTARSCERCGRTVLEPFYTSEEVGLEADGVSAHGRIRMVECKIKKISPTGQMVAHKYSEKRRLVVSLNNTEAYDEVYCGECSYVYTWEKGRLASPDEVQACRDGKIRQKETKRTVSYASGQAVSI